MKKASFFIFAVCILYLTGCHYNPGPNAGNIVVVRPAQGDTITGGTKNYQVTWSGTGINSVKTFEYSLDSGLTWTTIGTQVSDTYLYNWNVPDTTSDHSFLRIVDKNGVTGKSGEFAIKSSIPPGPGKTIASKVGSTYTFRNTVLDTNGTTVPGSETLTMDSVVEAGISYMGKSNVAHLVTIDLALGTQTGDTYINFETNGDISFYSGGAGAGFGFGGGSIPDWIHFGAQSHTLTYFTIADTSVDFNGTSVHIVVGDSAYYVNNGTFSISAKNLGVINMNQVISFTGSVIIPLFTSSQVSHLSMAPSIGYTTSTRSDPSKGFFPGLPASQGNESVLIRYTLR